ncbi:TolC family protein [Chitinophaga varians]|uniref:TolC family protein n=1 Tax=Chitinophaga varians TaxID=2202339 RepID=UPI00165EFB68|nr:TolC family protein [Chitinophaga varians]MBC9911124.1 TolC family protein [Chitinophaga varians]
MKRYIALTVLHLCCLPQLKAQQCPQYQLQDFIAIAAEHSINKKLATSTRQASYYEYDNFRASVRPQLLLTGTLIDYSKDYLAVRQPDGSSLYQYRTQNMIAAGLSLSQVITATGGTLSINSSLNRFDDIERKFGQYSTIPANIYLQQPLFGFNAFKWQKKLAPLRLEEANKNYIQQKENISADVVRYFFDVLDAQVNLDLSGKNLENQQQIYDIELKKVDLGTASREKLLQIKLQVLNSIQDQKQAEVSLQTALFNLNSYTASSDTGNIELLLPTALPVLNISLEMAIQEAIRNRAAFTGFIRRREEALRDLEQARKERLAINLTASYGLNNASQQFDKLYQRPNSQQNLSLGVAVPIVDWGRSRGKINLANSNLKTTEYTIAQEEMNIRQVIVTLVKNAALIRDNIEVSHQTDMIAQERYNLAQEQFKLGKLSVTDLNIALIEKDQARKKYITALRTFWDAYYQLRCLTLYDFVTGKKIL